MLVAFRVGFGDDGKAVAGLLSEVIGSIQTVKGCCTIRRASGVALQASPGDPICQGDVIETAADGRIGIWFLDGTVFDLFPGTRLALHEFVCDANGASHSLLVGVTGGTFAFMAGRVAETSRLTLDTPFGSIRGRAHSGGLGILSLAALTFSMIGEVRAADPDVVILDDDRIAYKDLDHGVFEIITKEAIPKYILVEDPEKTIVLHQQERGSSVSVNQVTNSATRMEELQAAQRDVLANYAQGIGGTGSGSPPSSVNSSPMQRINYTPADLPTLQNSPPPPLLTFTPVPEIITGKPPPDPPALTVVAGPTEIDTVAFDQFTATSGTFHASSSNSSTLTYGIDGGTAGSRILEGVTYDLSRTGPFGTLYLNSTTGAFSFVPDSGAINALTAATVTSFTVTVSDGTLSTSRTFPITINGVNDAAVISGTAAGTVIEAGVATSGAPAATGTLTDTDVDNPFNTFMAVGLTPSAHGYGSFAMTAAGVWTYTLDNANSAVQALNAGGILSDSFTVTTVDGTSQVVKITITGSNDSAVITGTTVGAVTETGSATPGIPTATGTLLDADPDNPANTFTAVGPTPSTHGYGSFAMTAAGVWTYTLDNANSAVLALNAGNTLTDSFTVSTVDGTSQVVTITIAGSNDSAVISGTTTGAVAEAGSATPGAPTATGTLTDTDLDNPANTFTAVGSTPSAQGYGSFAMTAAGVWTYTLDNANSAVQALNTGGILTDSFMVTTVDGTPQVVSITITGSNDSAVISGSTAGAVTETGVATSGAPAATGTLTDTDVDNPFNTFMAVGLTPSAHGYGSFAMTGAGVWTYTLDNANSTVQALNAGGVLTDSFTVTTVDGTPQVVSITITGSNDSAVISGTATGAVTETGSATPGIPTATGTLVDTDLDNPFNTFTAVRPTPSAQGYGSFAITAAGVWTYTLDNANSAVQALNAGNTLTDSFTVTTVDGTSQVVTITIAGSNDSAVISGTATGAVTETGSATPGIPTATGTLVDADPDNPFNTFTAVGPTPSAQGYGNFAMTAAGVWTYTLDNANSTVQALNAGSTLSDSFTVTTVDGTPQVVSITITGSNDPAVISGTTSGAVTEAGNVTPGTPTATGTLFDSDVDNPFNAFIAVSSPTPSAGGYGSFTMTAVGMWIYMLDNANSAVESLNSGDTLTDSFTVTTVDGTPQLVSITIHGATDADINDFDALATRATVTTEPPFVYGTTGADSIAGGGNDGQTVYGGAGGDTINGTGQADTIFAGSGNDTVKGNGGDDTIFGGSGIDTINGNNDDDTIVGGFGADNLTGSNGDDRFVYLFVADSNATRFDTITDFSSGSDRIDLTALGAFAFLALSSASTSVPPHTIAWIHDSANNQTIVYVNPTDQILSIGSSALLEIHLQGVVAVASTDFVFASETASASAAGEPINLGLAATAQTDGAVFAIAGAEGIVDDADARLQARDLGFSLDADRDLPESLPDFGHARFVSFGEDRTHPTEVNEANIVVTAENRQSVVPHLLHFAESTGFRFVFDPPPAPALDNTSAMTANDAMMHPDGAIHHAGITAPDAPGNIAEPQPDVGSEGGSGNAPPRSDGNNGSQVNSAVTPNEGNLGLPEVSVNHRQAVASLTANSGEPPARGNNNHSIPGDAGELGTDPSHGASSNAHGIGGNALSHSHANNGSQANSTVALNDNLGVPGVSGNHGQAVASLVANSGEPPAHGNNSHSIPGDASEYGTDPSHGVPPSNAHGMSGAAGTPGPADSFQFNHAMAGSESGSGNAPSHRHANNGSQTNSTTAANDDNLGVPEVSGGARSSGGKRGR
jgi:VCBS repeat-containing protein